MKQPNPGTLTAAVLRSLPAEFSGDYAPNTCKAYSRAVECFASFLGNDEGDDASVAAFLEAEAKRGLAPASLSLAYSAIGAAARSACVPDPRGHLTEKTLRRLRRQHADRGLGQVAGFRRRGVTTAAGVAATEGALTGLRDAALLLLASDGLLRISELAAVQCDHLEPADDGTGRLALLRSKTDQEGRGETLWVSRTTMAAVTEWRSTAGIAAGPLFRPVSRGGSRVGETPLSISAIRAVIRKRAQAVGIEDRVSGHSLRIGSAQSLVAAGASTAELVQAGRWKDSRTASRYAANELAERGTVARYFGDQGTNRPGCPRCYRPPMNGGPRPTPEHVATLDGVDWDALLEAAIRCRDRAWAPYSGFRVGAALLAANGRIYGGCNVENRVLGLTLCAERGALSAAVADGQTSFRAVAIATNASPPCAPCGQCRDALAEFSYDLPVLSATMEGKEATDRSRFTLRDLLPEPFVLRTE